MADLTPREFDGMTLEVVAVPLKGNPGEPGIKGKPGERGQSNYQVWLDAGNVGTEADFLATLKGEPGIPGTGLKMRGNWTITTYNNGDCVVAPVSDVDPSRVLWFFMGEDDYVSSEPPHIDTDVWVRTDIVAGIADAPVDGKTYARKDGAWVAFIP